MTPDIDVIEVPEDTDALRMLFYMVKEFSMAKTYRRAAGEARDGNFSFADLNLAASADGGVKTGETGQNKNRC